MLAAASWHRATLGWAGLGWAEPRCAVLHAVRGRAPRLAPGAGLPGALPHSDAQAFLVVCVIKRFLCIIKRFCVIETAPQARIEDLLEELRRQLPAAEVGARPLRLLEVYQWKIWQVRPPAGGARLLGTRRAVVPSGCWSPIVNFVACAHAAAPVLDACPRGSSRSSSWTAQVLMGRQGVLGWGVCWLAAP